ncbi:nucleotidyltransferase domain-containing protein (plasmid) [Sphaerimonospora sp. CA-214678]|uniref:nucleotidyltransferase domain-containing protein n=1 Tax=Sphaerimonospora sp. CA-214678 TaxID=3240029 RepID=UPI003D9167EA
MPDAPLPAVAVSGPDNVGKTTQVRLLTRRYGTCDLGPLDGYDTRWAEAKRQGLAAWWFHSASIGEVVDVLACSYLTRAAAARSSPPGQVLLLDRGMSMLGASVAATVAARDEVPFPVAADRAARLLAPYASDIAKAHHAEREVLLLHHADPLRGAEVALSRERAVTDVYRRYQVALNEHLHHRPHDTPIVVGDRSIMAVHGDLCARLEQTSMPIAQPVITQRWTVALGGMSESGKSTAGEYLQHEHGFARLKIGYLLDCAAARHRIADVYALPPVELAELLVLELDRYAAAHHYQRHLSIESLHRADLTRELGKLLGPALTVAYLHASPDIRCRRGNRGPGDVVQRDTIKRERGADRVLGIADLVIGNDRSRTELFHALDLMVRRRLWPDRSPRRIIVPDLGLPAHLAGFLDSMLAALTSPAPYVQMIAVTGSGGRGEFRSGWSDLDVLLVADPAATPRIAAALRQERDRLDGVKLGLSVITPGEIRAGALTSRLLYAITSITAGEVPVLWAVPGFRLPHPDGRMVAARNRHEGATAAFGLRRALLAYPIDIRVVYKTAALLAKIVLRCEGQVQPSDADALEAFAEFAGLPAPADPCVDSAAALWLAEQVLRWWLTGVEATS